MFNLMFFLNLCGIIGAVAVGCCPGKEFRRFYKIKSGHRSTSQLVAAARVGSLRQCENLALGKGGLAINFSEGGRDKFFDCEILACPEFGNLTTLLKDDSFDYYSAYGKLQSKLLLQIKNKTNKKKVDLNLRRLV